jgi:hypothetical protein
MLAHGIQHQLVPQPAAGVWTSNKSTLHFFTSALSLRVGHSGLDHRQRPLGFSAVAAAAVVAAEEAVAVVAAGGLLAPVLMAGALGVGGLEEEVKQR